MSEDVFTPEQVAALHRYQFGPWGPPIGRQESDPPSRMHPFTCPSRGDGRHFDNGRDHGILIPTTRGWVCRH